MWKLALLLSLGMCLIPAGDAVGKLAQGYGVAPGFIAWSRFAVAAVLILPLVPRGEFRHARDWRLWLRAACMMGGITSILTALSAVPLADAFSGLFVGPLVSVILCAVLLREQVTPLRWALVIVGFAGVLMVVRPSGAMDPYLLFAVLAGLFYGSFLAASRWLAGAYGMMTLLGSQLGMGAVLATPFAIGFWPEFSWPVAALLVMSGLFSMGGNLTLVYAYKQATAAQVAPFVYVQLLAATAIGYYVFSDIPTPLTWVGMLVIAAAGIASARIPAAQSTDRG